MTSLLVAFIIKIRITKVKQSRRTRSFDGDEGKRFMDRKGKALALKIKKVFFF